MATIKPFRALRPRDELAAQVASVPYDVVNSAEARALAEGNERSFLHVTKPEIDLASDVDPYSDAVYEKGAAALRAFREAGTLVQDDKACLYLYALTWRGRTQTGVVMLASIDEYNRNEVRKHEHTRPDKENDRVRHMEILGAQSGTVFLAHRDHAGITAVMDDVTSAVPSVDFTAADGVQHRLWVVSDDARIGELVAAFADAGPIYIADGHHRCASASRVAATRGDTDAGMLSVSFPVSEVQILEYNRVVRDLNGLDEPAFLDQVRERFVVTEGKPDAVARRQFAMCLGEVWYTLDVKPGSFDESDPVGQLDISILQAQLLGPVLGIGDPRVDKRIDFIGGIRGTEELEKRVHGDWAVAFALHATSMDDLLAIADAEQVMPPKSTWFEPKLRDGLFVNLL